MLRGDRIVNTPFDVRMAQDYNCKVLCGSQGNPLVWRGEDEFKVMNRIKHEYVVHL